MNILCAILQAALEVLLLGMHHNCSFPARSPPRDDGGAGSEAIFGSGATRAWLEVKRPTKMEWIIGKIPQRFLEGIGTVLAKSPSLRRKDTSLDRGQSAQAWKWKIEHESTTLVVGLSFETHVSERHYILAFPIERF